MNTLNQLESGFSRLIAEFGYSSQGARLVWGRLCHLDPTIASSFFGWWVQGIEPDLEVHGYSVKRLEEEHGMTPIAAFLTLDWLVREPERAQRSLEKGHDRVVQRESSPK